MIKYIDHYWAQGGVLELNTRTGSIQSTSKYKWQKAPHWGTAWEQNGRWFVLHNDNTSFILQNEKHIWRITSECEVSLRQKFFFRNFKIKIANETRLSIWYKPKYIFFSIIDPAHDDDEEESDDFFYTLFIF